MRRLVYTSAGNHHNIRQWLEGRRTFDLWVTHYGDGHFDLADQCTYWHARKGSKFQNLKHLSETRKAELAEYEAIFVLDDDIRLSGTDIENLFTLRRQHRLTVLQPAFMRCGKVSHRHTRFDPRHTLRYTNFVEVTCPLFETAALLDFLECYDGQLAGWGIDWWYMEVLARRPDFKAAIVDQIPCINPREVQKGLKQREIDMLQPTAQRHAQWEALRQKLGLTLQDRGAAITGALSANLVARAGTRLLALRRWMEVRQINTRSQA